MPLREKAVVFSGLEDGRIHKLESEGGEFNFEQGHSEVLVAHAVDSVQN